MDASAEVEPPRGWWLKRAVLQNPIAAAEPLRTPLDKRPYTQVILRPRALDSAQKALLGLLGGIIGLFLLAGVTGRLWGLVAIAGALLVLTVLAAWVIRQRGKMSWSATWHQDSVVVHDGRYGATRTWQEPLSAFEGVRTARAYLRQGNALMPNLAVRGIELVHPDPVKTVLLHAVREPADGAVLGDYARELGTRVID